MEKDVIQQLWEVHTEWNNGKPPKVHKLSDRDLNDPKLPYKLALAYALGLAGYLPDTNIWYWAHDEQSDWIYVPISLERKVMKAVHEAIEKAGWPDTHVNNVAMILEKNT